MKKLFLLIAVTALTATVANAQFSIGFGYVNSKNTLKADGLSLGDKAMNGVYIGADYGIKIWNGLSVQPGLNYSYMGYSTTEDGYTESWSEHFLNIPAQFRYTFDISDNFKVFGFTGPKFVVGLAAIEKYKEDGDKATVNRYNGKWKYTEDGETERGTDSDDAILSRFDVQWGVGAGVQFRSVSFKFGYDWGLMNRMKGDADGATFKRSQFYVGVGFSF